MAFSMQVKGASKAEIVILGAGVMGSAMAVPAASLGHRIRLVGTHLDEDAIYSVAGTGLHPRLGVELPAAVSAHRWTEFTAVMDGRPDLLVIGVSSAGVDWAIDRMVESMFAPVPVLMITKGLSARDGVIEVLPHLVQRALRARAGLDIAVMAVGGPCIAGELAAGRDTSTVFAGADRALLDQVIGLFAARFYHARPSTDLTGVELAAAFKNFFALGVGAAAGLMERAGRAENGAAMHNLTASLFAQALAEMTILVEALGGSSASVAGLAGAGDLYVTCLAGRNSRLGRLLGIGLGYAQAKAEHMAGDTIEGAELALALGPALEAMMARRTLPSDRLPLTRALIASVCRNRPLSLDWPAYHRADGPPYSNQ